MDMVNGTIAALPNFVLAILIFLVFYIIGKRTIIVRMMTDKRQKARHAGILLGKWHRVVWLPPEFSWCSPSFFPRFKLEV